MLWEDKPGLITTRSRPRRTIGRKRGAMSRGTAEPVEQLQAALAATTEALRSITEAGLADQEPLTLTLSQAIECIKIALAAI